MEEGDEEEKDEEGIIFFWKFLIAIFLKKQRIWKTKLIKSRWRV